MFPTTIRTSGVGIATAASRLGAAIGTFLLPVIGGHLGLGATMIFMGAVSLVGGITSLRWAPETPRRELSEISLRPRPGSKLSPAPTG